jgi:tRNA (5-methylaminomethyl-2-thiouridylate)-methyltransferase
MKVAVLLSGGVDSSVALRLLKEEGHELTAFYLKIWLEDELSSLGECPWQDDLKYARGVCEQADVPLEILSLQREYWDIIVSYAIRELKDGRTPNSDMFCNRLIKFGKFFDKIGPGFDKVASGHYALLENQENIYYMKKSPDPVKDQTYFLGYMRQDQLARALFPLGKYNKTDVRQLARKFALPNKDRKDSQGICFLGQIRYTDFVKHHLGELEGDFVDAEVGKIIGKHKGYWFYTIGQRHGLGLSGGPWYIVGKNIEKNEIYLARNQEIREQFNKIFYVRDMNWISGAPPGKDRLQVKIRHGAEFHQCHFELDKTNTGKVILDQPDQGIATGQFAVFYEGEYCLGAGIITNSGT